MNDRHVTLTEYREGEPLPWWAVCNECGTVGTSVDRGEAARLADAHIHAYAPEDFEVFVLRTRLRPDGTVRSRERFMVERETWLGQRFYGQGRCLRIVLDEASGDHVTYEVDEVSS